MLQYADGFGTMFTKCHCNSCKNSTPFYFPIKTQKIMLLTACPSIQTMRNSLLSVRFLRQIIYALFGEEGFSEKGLWHILDGKGLYWTHFNKCYNPKFYKLNEQGYLLDSSDLSMECAEKYLVNEINNLKTLEMIIVMGKATHECFKSFLNKFDNQIKRKPAIRYIDFPKDEENSEYDKLRRDIAKILNIPQCKSNFDKNELSSKTTGPMVGRSIEIKALNRLPGLDAYSYAADYDDGTVNLEGSFNRLDKLWIENVMNPLYMRNMVFTKCWTTLEKGIKDFLHSHFDPVKERYKKLHLDELVEKVLKNSHLKNNKNLEYYLYDSPRFNWQSLMNIYLYNMVNGNLDPHINLDVALYDRWEKISKALSFLRAARNIITHSDGFISTLEMIKMPKYENLNWNLANCHVGDLKFDGISVHTNLVYISEDGINAMRGLVNKTYMLLEELDMKIPH
jgi:hypothetical protein